MSPAALDLSSLMAALRADVCRRAIFLDLEALRSEASLLDWVGREGDPISEGAFLQAQRLLEAFVLQFPAPELSVDSRGAVVLDWLRDPDHMLSLTIESSGQLGYAFRAGDRRGTRTDWFRYEVPAALAADIAAVVGQ